VVALGLILSLAIGVSLGLLGGGGSILAVPVFHYVLGVSTHDAIAMSLIVVAATSAVAMLPHARDGNVRWRIGLAFGASSMLAAFAGGRVGALLPDRMLIIAFALVMVTAGVAMLLRARKRGTPVSAREIHLVRVVVIGLSVGLITGTLGAGGGFMIVPVLTVFGGLATREAVGTSLLVITLSSTAGVAGVAEHATFDLRLTAIITGIAIAGSLLGARVGRRLRADHLQRVFGWFVIAVGVLVVVSELT
jgi:uncharacterized protein